MNSHHLSFIKDYLMSKTTNKIIYGKCLLNKKNLKIFFCRKDISFDLITKIEKNACLNLSLKRKQEFIHSRSYSRIILSDIFRLDPLLVQLAAPLGRQPKLPKNFGYLSFSHCVDALVVVWSNENVGIDIERNDRKIDFNLISRKVLTDKEFSNLSSLDFADKCLKFIEIWVLKEALIKRNNGRILRDIRHWEFNNKRNLAINYSSSTKVKVKKIEYNNYFIGIASNQI